MKQKPEKEKNQAKFDGASKGKKGNASKSKLLRKPIKKQRIENNFEKMIREKIEFKMKTKSEVFFLL
jgi:hypothetical protein